MVTRKRVGSTSKLGGLKKSPNKRNNSKSKKANNNKHQSSARNRQTIMENEKKPFEHFTNMTGSVVAQSLEQAREAMKNYLQFLEMNLTALPHVDKDQKAKWMHHAEQNVAAAFEFAEKLTHVKDIQDVARIQTEFVQKQIKSLSEQAKDLGEAATKAATGTFKGGSS
jgi:hypothetical protein